MKAILSNKIYMEATPEYIRHLKEILTYRIPSYNDPTKPLVIKNFGVIRPGLITIPIGRVDLIPAEYEIVDKRILAPIEFPAFNGTLRASQQAIYDEIDDNCIINAKPSWGKTYSGLAIAGKLGQKTLIITHTVPLRNQWAREIEKVYNVEAGIIGSGKIKLNGPIVVSNVQSLYNCIDTINKTFGTIILDEMHHASAPTFSRTLDRSYGRYKIGLSGTILRKDGKHVVFEDYFGKKIFRPEKENSMDPEIHVVSSGIYFSDDQGKGWAEKITDLESDQYYKALVVQLFKNYVAKGHKVLVVSDRVQFLKDCAEMTGTKYITSEAADERESILKSISGDLPGLWGIKSIMSEGISQDNFSCLILASLINNEPLLEQLIGRIQRIVPGKQQPVVVDIKMRGNTVEKQFMNRMGHYLKQGYKVKYI